MEIKSIMLRFEKWHHSTDKAHCLTINGEEQWIPKKLAWNFTLNNKLGGHVTLPSWLYEKITGIKPENAPEIDINLIITKHKPERKEPIKPIINASLIR